MKISFIAAAALAAAPLALAAPPVQAAARSPLLDLSKDRMRDEVGKRYDAALAATRAEEVRKGADPRFTWASEAKVQCGIAIGFLKSGTVDEDSVNRCDAFAALLAAPPPMPPAPPPPPPAANCPPELKAIVFFDWNVDTPLPEASQTISQIVENRTACGWSRFTVVGHTDRSGPDRYNMGLSIRRAKNVAAMMESAGIAASDIATEGRGESQSMVETADGVREPQNRRVEISAASSGQ